MHSEAFGVKLVCLSDSSFVCFLLRSSSGAWLYNQWKHHTIKTLLKRKWKTKPSCIQFFLEIWNSASVIGCWNEDTAQPLACDLGGWDVLLTLQKKWLESFLQMKFLNLAPIKKQQKNFSFSMWTFLQITPLFMQENLKICPAGEAINLTLLRFAPSGHFWYHSQKFQF